MPLWADPRRRLRLSPGVKLNGIDEPDPRPAYEALVQQISGLGLAYLHVLEVGDRDLTRSLRGLFPGAFILNPYTEGRPTGPEELALVEDGTADLIAFGQLFLANPDLPRRLEAGSPFNAGDWNTFYGGDATGYTNYPACPPDAACAAGGRPPAAQGEGAAQATVREPIGRPAEFTRAREPAPAGSRGGRPRACRQWPSSRGRQCVRAEERDLPFPQTVAVRDVHGPPPAHHRGPGDGGGGRPAHRLPTAVHLRRLPGPPAVQRVR
ncbi:hypothetical protein AB0D13_08775 [Streptomyces sp. NPDC048430]|uniref:hypothetical protein n=1 Tax=Streptomyces sp. NPDC048430 TaxID=3155388 RepID=UPI0034125089